MKKLYIGFLLSLLLFLQATPVFAAVDCNWTTFSDGNYGLCAGGFATQADVSKYQVNFSCSKNCNLIQSQPLGAPIGFDPDTKTYYSCVNGGGFSQAVVDSTSSCVNGLPRTVCVFAGIAAGALTAASGGGLAVLLVAVGASCIGANAAVSGLQAQLDSCSPQFDANIVPVGGGASVCHAPIAIKHQIIEQQAATTETTFEICNQVPPDQPDRLASCKQCAGKQGVWTSIGCINYTPQSIIGTLVKVGLGIAGGVALIMILAAAFLFSTSQGDPKRTGQAKDLLTSAVIGLLFVIFSVTILQFIGVTVLHLPGFGT